MTWDTVTRQALPSEEVTHLHLLRHGHVDTGGVRQAYGWRDLPLSEKGRAQGAGLLRLASERLPRPAGIFASDLRRCLDLAEPLAARLGVPLMADAALREQSMGDWEGRPWSDLTAREPAAVRRWWTHYATTRPPSGESLGDLSERVDGWFRSHADQLRGRRWIGVVHIGVLRSLLCRALDVPLDQALRFAPLPGTHTWMMWAESGAVVQTLGERPDGMWPGAAAEARRVSGVGRSARIALSGSAGTGKTTLGRALAAELGVPYIPEGMRERIAGGLQLHALGHDGLRRVIRELWEEQCAREDAATGGYVADRSPADFLAFWLHYRLGDDDAQTRWMVDAVRARAERTDRVILLPFGVLPLVSDGIRLGDPWVQRLFQATVRGILEQELPPGRLAVMPGLTELDARVRWAVDLLREGGVRSGGFLSEQPRSPTAPAPAHRGVPRS